MDADAMERRGRGISADMSAAAVLRRLGIVSELHRLWLVLRRSKPLGPVEPGRMVAEQPDQPYGTPPPRP